MVNTQGHITEERAKIVNGALQGSLGSRQTIGPDLIDPNSALRSTPPYVSCSDWYCDFVRSGLITTHRGRLDGVKGSTAQIGNGALEDVAAVVLATGFDPEPCVGFLPEGVLSTLKYSPAHPSLLLGLAFHATHHPEVPNLGFVGFYRGAFWGVIQMQARFLAALWSSSGTTDALRNKLATDDSLQKTLQLRDDPRLSQFPMGDYPFLMQDFAEALSIEITPPLRINAPNLTTNGRPLEMMAPARYSPPNEDGQDNASANKLLQDAAEVLQQGLTTPRFASRAVFRSLLGTWKLERDLKSKLPTHPSGHFSGTAQFLLRSRTKEGIQCTTKEGQEPLCEDGESYEYLYIEDGDFKTDQGFGFRATRRYIYRYDDATGAMTVWFAKPDDNKRVDYFFHEVEFEDLPAGPEAHQNGWSAKSGHLCIDDYYNVKYNFKFNAVNLESWVCAYSVNGPQKDYTIHGTYTR